MTEVGPMVPGDAAAGRFSDAHGSPLVGLHVGEHRRYPYEPPFHPPQQYPELPVGAVDGTNHVYASVRELLRVLGMDSGRYGTPRWNPLGEIIRPGDRVVLKPNFIMARHLYRKEWKQLVSHGSVIRAVVDYVLIALKGKGRITITDGPATESSFEDVCRTTGVSEVVAYYSARGDMPVELVDIRREEWISEDFTLVGRRDLPGDPEGYRKVCLDEKSEFIGMPGSNRYGGPGYDEAVLKQHHCGTTHEYLLSGTVLEADVVINLPKLKTHKMAGITCCLKNLVGINGDKTWLPHHTCGFPKDGGDQFPARTARRGLEATGVRTVEQLAHRFPNAFPPLARLIKKVARPFFGDTRKTVRNGSWYGNQTLWRMCLDLNKALMYADKSGVLQETPQRRLFQIVDAIIAGEGDGPMAPDARRLGVLVGGPNSAAVDSVCAWVMGFAPEKIPSIQNAFSTRGCRLTSFGPEDVEVVSNLAEFTGKAAGLASAPFGVAEPHFGWSGHIEVG